MSVWRVKVFKSFPLQPHWILTHRQVYCTFIVELEKKPTFIHFNPCAFSFFHFLPSKWIPYESINNKAVQTLQITKRFRENLWMERILLTFPHINNTMLLSKIVGIRSDCFHLTYLPDYLQLRFSVIQTVYHIAFILCVFSKHWENHFCYSWILVFTDPAGWNGRPIITSASVFFSPKS